MAVHGKRMPNGDNSKRRLKNKRKKEKRWGNNRSGSQNKLPTTYFNRTIVSALLFIYESQLLYVISPLLHKSHSLPYRYLETHSNFIIVAIY